MSNYDAVQENQTDNSSSSQTETNLTKRDIRKAFWIWFFFSHSAFSYERLQGSGFAHAMTPIIRKLYTSKQDISDALKRHLAFFNTEVNIGAIIHGIIISMEEQRAKGAKITDETINSMKTGLMGPIAGIGDTLMQGIMAPVLLSVAIGLAMDGNVLGPILYTVAVAVVLVSMGYIMWMRGYTLGSQAVEKILQGGLINRVTKAAGVMGCMVLGALTGQFVFLSTPLEIKIDETVVNLQADVLDQLIPQMLPLAFTLLVLYFVNKGLSSTKILGLIALIGGIGGLIGLF